MNEIKFYDLKKEEKTFGMLCHLLSFVCFLGIPFGHLVGPLVMWVVKKDTSEFVDACGKESINFQISMTIYVLVCFPLCLILVGYFLLLAVCIIGLICVIKASIKANEGELYRYPFTIRFL